MLLKLAGDAGCSSALVSGGVFAALAACLTHYCSVSGAADEAADVTLLQPFLLVLEELLKGRDVSGGGAAKRAASTALAAVRAKAVVDGVPAVLTTALPALSTAGGAAHVIAIVRRVQVMLAKD